VRAATAIFERDGFEHTNSNVIARAAGYSPGTFYKHFADKKEIFLAAHSEWVRDKWRGIGDAIRQEGALPERAAAAVRVIIERHRAWRGFRADLRALTARDREVRHADAKERKAQLRGLTALGGVSLEEDVLLMLTIERVADAIVTDEAALLGADEKRLVQALADLLARRLSRAR
jgi:AcrR family transcriptional regulator